MSTVSANTRTRSVLLPNMDSARISALLADLQNLDGVTGTRVEDNTLTIIYTFPETGFDIILDTIRTTAGALSWRCSLAACMERIEREHLQAQCGWDIYTRDIYVAWHTRETEHRNKQPRKPWQRAKPTADS